MEDICFLCQDNLATVTFNCGHRIVCQQHLESLVTAALPRIPNCPICRQPISRVTDTTDLQLRETTIADGTERASDLRTEYPFGCLLFGNAFIPADADMVRVVREAMAAVNAGRLDMRELKIALRNRLTPVQIQLVFVELIKNDDLHKVLEALDDRIYERTVIVRSIQTVIVRTIESTDSVAIASRALVGTIADTVVSVSTGGLSRIKQFNFAADGVSNALVFSVFALFEVYRYSKREISFKTACENVGEHAVGTGTGYGGAYLGMKAGALAGAAVGSVFPIVGTGAGGIAGAIIGIFAGGMASDAAGRWIYRKYLPRREESIHTTEESIEMRLTAREIAEKAAQKFHILLDNHTFAEANSRFRQLLLTNHPDKNLNASDDEKERLKAETIDILACWTVVRDFYNDRGDIENSEAEESYIKLNVLKERVVDAVAEQWRVIRTWFGEVGLGRNTLDTERIDTMTIYV